MSRNIAVTLECFVEKDGKFLMLHRNENKRIMPGVWMAPGGHREHGEGLFEAARREIMEETGLTIKNLRVRATGVAYLEDLDQEVFFHFVKADYAGGEVIEDPADGELVWLTPEEILKLPTVLREIPGVLDYVVDEKKPVVSYKVKYSVGNEMTQFLLES